MGTYIKLLWIILTTTLISYNIKSQNLDLLNSKSGFEGFNFATPDSSVSNYVAHMLTESKKNLQILKNTHKVSEVKSGSHPLFIFPLKPKDDFRDLGYFSISAYVDHNPSYPNKLLDYNCGNISYDLAAGYNHSGTDFFLYPFSWNKMDSGSIQIVAAAPGVLSYKIDGNYDRNCGLNSSTNWNGVTIVHDDGSTSIYGHMKKNSLTSKEIGSRVEAGEVLGLVGSSGSSTGPHLHFEVHDAQNNLIDPFVGSCNSSVNETWWADQIPYKYAALNRVSTNKTLPVYNICPTPEIENENLYFDINDSIYIIEYFKNLSPGDKIFEQLQDPNNVILYDNVVTSNYPYYAATSRYMGFKADYSFPAGRYRFIVSYKNNTYVHKFYIGIDAGISPETLSENISIFPNPAHNFFRLQTNITSSKYSLTITNTEGKIVLKNNFKHSRPKDVKLVNVSNLKKGLYIVNINNGYTTCFKKLVIQ